MKKLAVFCISVVTLLVLLATPPSALADQGQKRHRGDVWVSCIPNAPATNVERAFIETFVQEYKTQKTCYVKRQQGWGPFQHSRRLRNPKFPKR